MRCRAARMRGACRSSLTPAAASAFVVDASPGGSGSHYMTFAMLLAARSSSRRAHCMGARLPRVPPAPSAASSTRRRVQHAALTGAAAGTPPTYAPCLRRALPRIAAQPASRLGTSSPARTESLRTCRRLSMRRICFFSAISFGASGPSGRPPYSRLIRISTPSGSRSSSRLSFQTPRSQRRAARRSRHSNRLSRRRTQSRARQSASSRITCIPWAQQQHRNCCTKDLTHASWSGALIA
mmetsp:Transcript_33097/g.77387  ORF Transcript_33097/g.77387 Transcript_33097/m.77387 type:complete len:239 (+) Transcript_33097:487-1203(+)